MKSARRIPPADPTAISRGKRYIPVPGLAFLIRGAIEMRGITSSPCNIIPANQDSLLYVFTRLRLKVDAPGRPWIVCEPGTAILMPNHTCYLMDTSVGGGGHHCWFSFEDLFFDPLYASAQNETGMARYLDPTGRLGAAMQEMVTTVDDKRDEAFWALQYQGRAVLEQLRAARRLEPGLYELAAGRTRRESALVGRVANYFLKNLAAPLDLATIAAAMHVSKSTLSHAYQQQTGESPLQTLRRMRIHQVKALLTQNLSLSAIAEMTGFYDAHHVSREFRRAEGISPSRFVERIRDVRRDGEQAGAKQKTGHKPS